MYGELFDSVMESSERARVPYSFHKGYFYCDIGNGTDPNKYDYCIIAQTNGKAILLVMHNKSIIAFDAKQFLANDFSYPLNYKKLASTDEAYAKFMKWIGKMVKKDERGRYYNNRRYHEYDYSDSDFNIRGFAELADEIKSRIKNDKNLG
jgi:ADP-heptose:LPS heptosyltransferase